jgi:hypothetical protein
VSYSPESFIGTVEASKILRNVKRISFRNLITCSTTLRQDNRAFKMSKKKFKKNADNIEKTEGDITENVLR